MVPFRVLSRNIRGSKCQSIWNIIKSIFRAKTRTVGQDFALCKYIRWSSCPPTFLKNSVLEKTGKELRLPAAGEARPKTP